MILHSTSAHVTTTALQSYRNDDGAEHYHIKNFKISIEDLHDKDKSSVTLPSSDELEVSSSLYQVSREEIVSFWYNSGV